MLTKIFAFSLLLVCATLVSCGPADQGNVDLLMNTATQLETIITFPERDVVGKANAYGVSQNIRLTRHYPFHGDTVVYAELTRYNIKISDSAYRANLDIYFVAPRAEIKSCVFVSGRDENDLIYISKYKFSPDQAVGPTVSESAGFFGTVGQFESPIQGQVSTVSTIQGVAEIDVDKLRHALRVPIDAILVPSGKVAVGFQRHDGTYTNFVPLEYNDSRLIDE